MQGKHLTLWRRIVILKPGLASLLMIKSLWTTTMEKAPTTGIIDQDRHYLNGFLLGKGYEIQRIAIQVAKWNVSHK